ncbi:hypothetical protein ENSA5_39550 [Enhygromyxa salina]|uniref:Uncharacterized protein n=1 Tax=Enhygromyxa salina TaxID=215803 RepID=A0A2S9XRK2_9BACT|nr:hypothetical protein [Enhygromyxa salina]PRP95370.1 hypothetical protein ENSA5_39550 [Enhygromyxa salina]
MSVDTFDFSVGDLDTLIAGVQDSIDEGLTVEETVEGLTLTDDQGYALWDGIHSAVNVPNTYTELSE